MRVRHFRRAALVLGLPFLAAPKCVPYEPVDGTPFQSASQADVVPGGPCRDAGEAHLRVASHAFQIECGCEEAEGKTCTIPVGTTVIWTFADSEEHDLTSEGGAFGSSDVRLTGDFEFTFDEPGRYPYRCAIHTGDMSGYAIVVQ